MTKNENFKISDLLKAITYDESEFNVRFFATEVLLAGLGMSFSIVIDFLIHRLVFFLENNSRAHGDSWCQVFVVRACFFYGAHFKGLFLVFKISRVYGSRFVHVKSPTDGGKQKAFELSRVIF